LTNNQRRLVEAGAAERKRLGLIHDELKAAYPNSHILEMDVDNAV
jgi:hypothetical protein